MLSDGTVVENLVVVIAHVLEYVSGPVVRIAGQSQSAESLAVCDIVFIPNGRDLACHFDHLLVDVGVVLVDRNSADANVNVIAVFDDCKCIQRTLAVWEYCFVKHPQEAVSDRLQAVTVVESRYRSQCHRPLESELSVNLLYYCLISHPMHPDPASPSICLGPQTGVWQAPKKDKDEELRRSRLIRPTRQLLAATFIYQRRGEVSPLFENIFALCIDL